MIIINPGTGPVPDATESNARAAVRLLVEDLAAQGAQASWTEQAMIPAGGGRYQAIIDVNGLGHEVEMPGCDPAVTRESRPWYSPRLYVDGQSWLWKYALSVLLAPDEEGE